MESPYSFESIVNIGEKPMDMLPTEKVNIFLITLVDAHNPGCKIQITTTGESIFGRKLLNKCNNNEVFNIDIS